MEEMRDAFALVNLNGKAFRNARVDADYLAARLAELKWAAVTHMLKEAEREEQRQIKETIREEERAQREFERAMRESAKEEETLRRAMEKAQEQIEHATAEQRTKYELQLSELNERLREAEERNQRAISMAQQTKRGHVYIISNVGSFGENVYKIGLTRRLEPLDRIRELGDSSVPFEFDVHALIFSEDAPALENRLHKHFVLGQINKVNHRKEFFRVQLAHIRNEIESFGLTAKWTMASDAAEYRESQAIEVAIAGDPVKRDAWLKRQLELDPVAGFTERDGTGELAQR
jgi:DNA repair exonuclease SbcCD ATPase subunit